MTTYAKLTPQGALETLRRIPHISNPTEATRAAYATVNGYKPVRYTEAPAASAAPSWEETDTEIRQTWAELPLEEARAQAVEQVQQWRNTAMATTCTLETPYGWPLEYSQEAVSLAQGTLILMLTGISENTSWTDADNTRHDDLTIFDMKMIASLLARHIRGIQDKADDLRRRISEASAQELPDILQLTKDK